jgi:hypothetical protein
MTWLILIAVAAVVFWRQRSEGVVTVNPLKRPLVNLPDAEELKADFTLAVSAIQAAARKAAEEADAEAKKGTGGAKLPKHLGPQRPRGF